MAIPFSRSLRSMNHDRFQPGLIAIVLICLVLVFWLVWFFVGQLPIYAATTHYSVREDGMLLANFPAESLPQIIPGQQAELVLAPQAGQATEPLQAEVMQVPTDPAEPVEIYLFGSQPPAGLEQGQLKILVGNVSPARLIWQSMQQ